MIGVGLSLIKQDVAKILPNKNWVTLRDKCSEINVQFKWHNFFFLNRTLVRFYFAQNFIWWNKSGMHWDMRRTVILFNPFFKRVYDTKDNVIEA